MRLLFDTNILLDFCDPRRVDFREPCLSLIKACIVRDVEMMTAASSLKDVYYVLCKAMRDEHEARNAIGHVMETFELLPLLEHNVRKAYHSDEPDFEDGLIRAVAEDNAVDAIVTRDAAAFQHASVLAMDAVRCLELIA